MSWTEERVSLLRKLWGEGHTAAEIAKELGGVTRNAVIGKAHRLKLSNRVSPIQQNRKPANKNVERKKSVEKIRTAANTSVRKAPSKPVVTEEIVVKTGKMHSLMDLQPRMCRWPSGDPKEENFGFCGEKVLPGLPYCECHSKVAYQTSSRSRVFSADKEAAQIERKMQLDEARQAAS